MEQFRFLPFGSAGVILAMSGAVGDLPNDPLECPRQASDEGAAVLPASLFHNVVPGGGGWLLVCA